MSHINWIELLGWNEEEINDLRFVGYSYIKEGHYATAKTFFESLVVLCPDSAYDLQTLGALHLEMGNPLEALNYLDRSLKLDPEHAPTLLNRTKALLLLGYHRQGLAQATLLKESLNKRVANQAEALLLSYS